MSNQDILNQLSLIECALYYRRDGHDDREGVSFSDLDEVYNHVNNALIAWHRVTGCTLDRTTP